jgi:hypothetical protein
MKNTYYLIIILVFLSIFTVLNAQQMCSSTIEPLNPHPYDDILVINSVLWVFGAGETCPNLSDFSFQKFDTVLYLYLYYNISGMWPQLGCTSTDTSFIGKLDSGKYTMYIYLNEILNSDTTFTTNSDTLEFNVSNSSSIIEDRLKSLINIYPVPTERFLFLDFPGYLEIESLMLFNLQGKRLLHYDPKLTKLYIAGIDPGLYFLYIRTNKGSAVKKVIVK